MDSRKGNIDSDQYLLQAQAHIWNHTFSFINSVSLKCAIELGIPEIIHNHAQPMTLPELIAALPIHPSKAQHVPRLMRILSHSGFFAQQKIGHDDQKGYVLTHASHLLLKDNPFSLAQFVLLILDPCMTAPWQHMSSWFQNDDLTPFKTAHGMPIWSYTAQNPKFDSFFNGAMASDTLVVVKIVTDKCKHMFQGINTLVDVGGGTGTMAKGIADALPDLECTVLDLPHVVSGLEGTKNLKFLGGDMFEAVPHANAVLLKFTQLLTQKNHNGKEKGKGRVDAGASRFTQKARFSKSARRQQDGGVKAASSQPHIRSPPSSPSGPHSQS